MDHNEVTEIARKKLEISTCLEGQLLLHEPINSIFWHVRIGEDLTMPATSNVDECSGVTHLSVQVALRGFTWSGNETPGRAS